MANLSGWSIFELILDVTPRDAPAGSPPETTVFGGPTTDGYTQQTYSRMVTAARIAYCESGGDPKAVGKIDPDDRGLWQWNRRAHPDISDADAFDAKRSTQWAYTKSNGWRDLASIWHGADGTLSRGFDPNSSCAKAVDQSIHDAMGYVRPVDFIPGTTAAAEAVGGVLGGVLGWAEALGRLLSKLIDPAWWRRVGVGALGVFMILVAVVLVATSRTVG